MENPLYEPREDSFLIEKHVSKYSSGKKVLDMGTGSGILAKAALSNAKEVYAVDKNEEIQHEIKGISFIHSDLFSNLAPHKYNLNKPESGFDLIIFNPPYLPDDERIKDIALDGGPVGNELILRFLSVSRDYLRPGGRILLLFSSLSGPLDILKRIDEYEYRFKIIDTMKLDFEELFVYIIDKPWKKGKRGVIYKTQCEGKELIVKRKNPNSEATLSMMKEGKFLEKVNLLGIGPKVYHYDNEEVIMEYISGELIGEYIARDGKNIRQILVDIIKQCHELDKAGINKFEMTNPYKHIIISDKNVMIDFERCIFTEKPKNVTQFLQYITSFNVISRLKELGLNIEREKIIEIGNKYKEGDIKINEVIDYLYQ